MGSSNYTNALRSQSTARLAPKAVTASAAAVSHQAAITPEARCSCRSAVTQQGAAEHTPTSGTTTGAFLAMAWFTEEPPQYSSRTACKRGCNAQSRWWPWQRRFCRTQAACHYAGTFCIAHDASTAAPISEYCRSLASCRWCPELDTTTLTEATLHVILQTSSQESSCHARSPFGTCRRIIGGRHCWHRSALCQ